MIRLAKLSLTGVEDGNLEEKYLSEQAYTLKAYALKDSAETRRAFVEKREAKFSSPPRASSSPPRKRGSRDSE